MAVAARIVDRVPPEHRAKIQTPLDAAASAALTSMARGLMRPAISDAQAAPLVAAGYAQPLLGGGYMLTDVGQVRAMMENGQ